MKYKCGLSVLVVEAEIENEVTKIKFSQVCPSKERWVSGCRYVR